MRRTVSLLIAISQVALGGIALWMLYDVNRSSDVFSRQNLAAPFRFTWAGVLVPAALFIAIGFHAAAQMLYWLGQGSRWRWCSAGFWLSAVVLVAVWWVVLGRADTQESAYTWFFVQSGALQPNEIMGASFSLYVVVMVLSLAALLGVVPLGLCFLNSRTGSTTLNPPAR